MTEPSICGTHKGFQYHRRHQTPVCDPCRVARNEYMRAYKAAHRSTILAAKKVYRESNQDKIKAYRAQYDKTKMALSNHKRKAYKLNNGHEPYTVVQVLAEYGAVCYLCEVDIDLDAPRQAGKTGWQMGLHLDHVVPLSKGGPDCLDNVAPTHAICNLSKGDS